MAVAAVRRDGSFLTVAAAAAAVLVVMPSLVKGLEIERANRAVLRALMLDRPKDASWMVRDPASSSNGAAWAEATDRYPGVTDRLDWKGRSRMQGLRALSQGDRSGAATAFAVTDDEMSRFWGAKLAAGEKRFGDAARLLSRDYPAAMTLLDEKAATAGARGDTEESNVFLEIAARCPVDEGDGSALIARGTVRLAVRHYDLALEDFNTALSLCPDCYQAYLYRGQTLLAQGIAPQRVIEQDLFRAVTLAPQKRDAALGWAQWLLRLHRWEEAEAAFKAWDDRYPSDLESALGLAFVYCHTGRPQAGQSRLRRFLERSTPPKADSDRIAQLLENCP